MSEQSPDGWSWQRFLGRRRTTANLGARLRDWFNARDVKRWERKGAWPPTLERAYWTRYEYERDLVRLEAHMYHLTSEHKSLPYTDVGAQTAALGPRALRPSGGRQPRLYRVSYERLSYDTWAGALPDETAP